MSNELKPNQRKRSIPVFAALVLLNSLILAQAPLPKLAIGPDGRFLVKETGEVFVWIGETNWKFAKIGPEWRDRMLDKRQSQGFTVMLVSAREELYNGEGGPYGANITQLNDAWWKYLEAYVDAAAQRGIYVGITLGWWGIIPNNSAEDLYRVGFEAATRFNGKTNVIWMVAGEAGGHSREQKLPDEKVGALVAGIRAGDTDDKLLSIHADFRRGTSISNHASLVDFNNWQTSQWCCLNDLPRNDDREWTAWEAVAHDYGITYDTPSGVKPTLDSEAWYENNKDFCGTTPRTIRRRAWFTILAGAFGHNYGAGGIWDALVEPTGCSGSYLDALEYEGAEDIGHLSAFLHKLENDFMKLRPKQEMISSGQSENYDRHVQAAMAIDGSYALIYDADGGPLGINLNEFVGESIQTTWFDPATGIYRTEPVVHKRPTDNHIFASPTPNHDWVLLLRAI